MSHMTWEDFKYCDLWMSHVYPFYDTSMIFISNFGTWLESLSKFWSLLVKWTLMNEPRWIFLTKMVFICNLAFIHFQLSLFRSQKHLISEISEPLYTMNVVSDLLKRLFLETILKNPVGSVTELSLLLSSSNCWSKRSPASLSVSLLEQALKHQTLCVLFRQQM